jgi:Domain of unknown function (DUF4184)
MPFTASHIAAIVPIYAGLGRFRVASALVIGSMAPDFHYFLPIDINRVSTHSFWGLLAFCLPFGLAAYLVYHLFAKHALIALLPDWIADRVDRIAGDPWTLPKKTWGAVAGAILIGASTHIVWDSFTHRGSFGVAFFPELQSVITTVWGWDVYGYALLQHVSTLVGLVVIAWYAWRWLRQQMPFVAEYRPRLRERTKRAIWMLIVAASIVNGALALVPYLAAQNMPQSTALPAFEFVTSTIAGGLCVLGVFSLAWQVRLLQRFKQLDWLGR